MRSIPEWGFSPCYIYNINKKEKSCTRLDIRYQTQTSNTTQSRMCKITEKEPATTPTTPVAQQTAGNLNTCQGAGSGGNNNGQGTGQNNNNDRNSRGRNGGANNNNDRNASSISGVNPQHFKGAYKDLNSVLGMPNERIDAKDQYDIFTEKLATHVSNTF